MTNVLITGGTGFIGSHTVEHFLEMGYEVHCIVRPGRKGVGWLANLPVRLLECDLRERSLPLGEITQYEYIIHIAGVTKALQRKDFFEGNVESTRHLLESAVRSTRLKKFILMGSLTAAGPSADGIPLDESAPCQPITTYGESKLAAEQLCLSYADRLPVVVLRPPAVYGPRDKDILEFFRWIRWGFLPFVGTTEKTLTFIHARDLARATLLAATSNEAAGKVYFVSNESSTSLEELGTMLAGIAEKKISHLRIPASVLFGIAAVAQTVSTLLNKPPLLNMEKVRDLEAKHWVCSPNRIREDLGFKAGIPLHTGLEETYHWYKSHQWL